MKPLMIVCAAVAMLTGCEALNVDTRTTLFDATQKDYHPVRGEKFVHDGNGISVFQVLRSEGFVLAREDYNYKRRILDRGLVIRVDTQDDYANDEYLRPGMYEYVGAYTYDTESVYEGVKRKGSNTVRVFKRVSAEKSE